MSRIIWRATTVAVLVLVLAGLAGCDGGSSTPTPIPTVAPPCPACQGD